MSSDSRTGLTDAARRRVEGRVAEAARRLNLAELREPNIKAAVRGEPFRLTDVQQAYLVGRLDEVDLGGVGCHSYSEFDIVNLDVDRCERALRVIVARHDMMRAVVEGTDRQRVLSEVPDVTISRIDLSGATHEEERAQLAIVRREMSHRRFDLTTWPWFDFRVTQMAGGCSRLHVGVDVMMIDGPSLQLLIAELWALYEGRDLLPPPALTFQDYILTLDNEDRAAARGRDEAYWDQWLESMPTAPDLPRGKTGKGAPRFDRRSEQLTAGEWRRLNERARAMSVPVVSLLIATYAETLFRWSGTLRFCINLTLYDRQPLHPDVHRLVGNFTSMVLLAVEPTSCIDPDAAARTVHRTLWEALEHRSVGGVEVLRMAARRDVGGAAGVIRAPVVFTSMIGTAGPNDADATRWSEVFGVSQTPQVVLDCQVYESGGGLRLVWDALEDAFPPGLLDAMFATFRALLKETWLVDAKLGAWMPAPERPVPFAFADEGTALIHDGFLRCAAEWPDAPAVDHGGRSVSYGELHARASAVARLVSRSRAPIVAVCMHKGVDQIAAVLGVTMGGGAYLPIAVDAPDRRIARLLELGEVALVITDEANLERLGRVTDAPLHTVTQAMDHPDLGAITRADADSLAYVIFTSGSTGSPKGVTVRHRAAVNTIAAVNRELGIGPKDSVLGVSSLAFDLSVYDIFGLLAAGGRLVLPNDEYSHDPGHWLDLVREHRVTVWNSVPALFELLVEELERRNGEASAPQLRLALLSGDWIPVDLPDRGRATIAGLDLVSLGGATEAAIWSVWHRVGAVAPHAVSVPYGKAMPGQRLLVLDPRRDICPTWVEGDLYIDGAGLADGYLGDPSQTAESFPVDSRTFQRMYRTGDRARLLPNGEFEFLGRRDRQTKIRGHRIELGEIEHALRAHPSVVRCVVAIVRDVADRQHLAAYVVVDGKAAEQELRVYLGERLPQYMVPQFIMSLDDLPLTGNGKIDLAALPRPSETSRLSPAHSQVRSTVLDIAITLFNAVLGGAADENTDLLQVGGTSLDAVRIVVRARDIFRVTIPLRQFLTRPTVRQLATLADEMRRTAVSHSTHGGPIRLATRQFSLSPAQAGLWALHRADPASLAYNTVDGFLVRGAIDEALLAAAVADVVHRHDALRTIFGEDEQGVPYQKVLDHGPGLTLVTDEERAEPKMLVEAIGRREARRAFALYDAPPVRFVFARCDETCGVLVMAMHHIICDAWSLEVLLRDLLEAYANRAAGFDPAPAPALQPGDLLVWRKADADAGATMAMEAGWRRLLADAPLPISLPPPARAVACESARRYFVLDEKTTDVLRRGAVAASASLYVVLLHLFARTLGTLTGANDLVIGTPVADRFHPLTEPLVGMFINTVPIRLRFGNGSHFAALQTTREQILEAMDLRELPFQEIVRAVNPPRTPGRHPLFSVMFALQGGPLPHGAGGELDVTPMPLELASAKFDLTLECRSLLQGIGCFIEYRATAVDPDFVVRLQNGFERECATFELEQSRSPPFDEHNAAAPGRDWAAELPSTGLVGFVVAQARRTPNAIAIETPTGTLTYAELIDRAHAVAAALPLLKTEDVVAVRGGPTAEVAVAALGVLLAGGIFTLLEAKHPTELQSRMVVAVGATLVIETSAQGADLSDVSVVALTDLFANAASCSPKDRARSMPVHSGSLAYVAFTSGSTGQPAAVALPHSAIGARVAWGLAHRTILPGDRVLMMTSIGFDVAICEIFETLAAGGTLVTAPTTDLRSVGELAREIDGREISVINLTPSMLRELLRAPDFHGDSLRRVNSGAEPLADEVMTAALAALPRAELYNLYGLTECAVDSTIQRCRPDAPAAVGHGLAGAEILILDERLNAVEAGGAGEVWIAGPGLARGYMGQPDQTAARFLPRPGGGRMYRTGDRGRLLPDGALEMLGRSDDQIKIRGVRIEIAEVASAIRRHPRVTEAMVLPDWREDGSRALGALVAASDTSPGELRAHLQRHLPSIFVPSRIVIVGELPRGTSGKLDRAAALDLIRAAASSPAGRGPRDLEEHTILALFQEMLGVPVTDGRADFFELGGHSLLAGRLAVMLSQKFGVAISIADIIEHPTVEALAARVRDRGSRADQRGVTMRAGAEPALFLMHPLGGEVICYAPLVRRLREGRAVIGLRAPAEGAATVDHLAFLHAETIMRSQPSGPCHLAGWSVGGVLALATAAELERAGRQVAGLTLIDTSVKVFSQEMVMADLLRAMVAEIDADQSRLPDNFTDVSQALAWIRESELLPWDSAEVELLRRLDAARALDAALRSYSPVCVAAPLTLVRAQETPEEFFTGWRDLSRGGGRELTLPGNHYSILREPRLAAVLDC